MTDGNANTGATAAGAAALIREAKKLLAVCHVSADGDTLGSAYALKHAFPEKEVVVCCADTVAERLSFICGGEPPLRPSQIPENLGGWLVVSLDTASLPLAGGFASLLGERADLKIDHHAISDPFARHNLIESSSSSCGELIFDILTLLGAMNAVAASALYAAIASDTGCFKYSNTTAATHRAAAALIEAGADHSNINTLLFDSKTQKEIAAERMTLDAIKYHRGGQIVSVCITNAMKAAFSLTDEDIDEISSIPRSIKGVELSVVIKQKDSEPERFKISMRSGPLYAASELCAMFGGGGHLRAAGASIEAASAEEAEKSVMERVLAAAGEIAAKG